MTKKKSNTHDAKQRLPQFFKFLIPLIEVLKGRGGKAKSSDVISKVIVRKKPRGAYRASRCLVQIYEAKAFLAKTGYLASPQKGIWKLTTKGRTQMIREGDLPEIHSQNKGWRAYWFGEDSLLSGSTPDGSLGRPASPSR
jgi:hypothetical protein